MVVARNLGTAVCFGIASASAILLGKEIGDNQIEKAKRDTHPVILAHFLGWGGGGNPDTFPEAGDHEHGGADSPGAGIPWDYALY